MSHWPRTGAGQTLQILEDRYSLYCGTAHTLRRVDTPYSYTVTQTGKCTDCSCLLSCNVISHRDLPLHNLPILQINGGSCFAKKKKRSRKVVCSEVNIVNLHNYAVLSKLQTKTAHVCLSLSTVTSFLIGLFTVTTTFSRQ